MAGTPRTTSSARTKGSVDDNGDGTIDSKDGRALEFVVGEENPRFTTGSAEGGKWEVTADLSTWADKIADGTVRRVEIAVMPELANAEEVVAGARCSFQDL